MAVKSDTDISKLAMAFGVSAQKYEFMALTVVI